MTEFMVADAPRITHSAAERPRETGSSIPLQVNHVHGRGRMFAPLAGKNASFQALL